MDKHNEIDPMNIVLTSSKSKQKRRLSGGVEENYQTERKNARSVDVSKQHRFLSESPVRSLNPIKEDVRENQHQDERPYFLVVKPENENEIQEINQPIENNQFDEIDMNQQTPDLIIERLDQPDQ